MSNRFLKAVTTIYILVPSFLFVYGWLRLPFAIITLMILTGFIVTIFIDFFHTYPTQYIFYEIKKRQIVSRDSIIGIVLVFLLIGIWLAFSGAGGIGFQNSDYKASNALPELCAVSKGADWGRRLMKYAWEHTDWEGELKPVVKAVRIALFARSYSYNVSRKENYVDPLSGQLVKRKVQ